MRSGAGPLAVAAARERARARMSAARFAAAVGMTISELEDGAFGWPLDRPVCIDPARPWEGCMPWVSECAGRRR